MTADNAAALRRLRGPALVLAGALLGASPLLRRARPPLLAAPPLYPFRIALTFDDGPHAPATEALLDVLRRRRAAATFFVVGKQVERYPALVKAMVRRGHEVANHTFNHPDLRSLDADRVLEELDLAREAVEQAAGVSPFLFRPPGGRYNAGTIEAARRGGYRMALWTVFPRDHEGPPVEELRRRVLADARDGGVVLLHSGMDSTLRALPGIIEDLRARGFRFLTLSRMLEEDPDPSVRSSWYVASDGYGDPGP